MEPNNLKCCGNCLSRYSADTGDTHEESCPTGRNLESSQICKDWKYDGLDYRERIVRD